MLRRQVPASVTRAVQVLIAIVLVSGVTALLTWVQRDEVILSWAKGNPSAQEILASGGIDALRDSAIVPKFVPLALVSLVVFLLLATVLAAFLVDGHGWSRLVLTLMAFFGVLVAALGLPTTCRSCSSGSRWCRWCCTPPWCSSSGAGTPAPTCAPTEVCD